MSESDRQNEWNSSLDQVKTFAANNGKWPSTTSKDLAEKKLAQWWSRQKYLLNKKANGEDVSLSAEKETTLKAFLESHASLERDGVWDTNYKAVVERIKADNKLWSYSKADPKEQKYIRWWNQQKSFARKFKTEPSKTHGGMTQERYDKITALMRVTGYSLEETSQSAVSVSVPVESTDNTVQS